MNEKSNESPIVRAPKNHATSKVMTRIREGELSSIFGVDLFFKAAALADKVVKKLGLDLKDFVSETKVLQRQDEKDQARRIRGKQLEGMETQELTLMKRRVPIEVMRKLDEIRAAKLVRMGGKPGDTREGYVDTGVALLDEGGTPNAVLQGIVGNALREGYTLTEIIREIRPARYTQSDEKKAHMALYALLDALELTLDEYDALSDEEWEKLDTKATDKIEWLRNIRVGAFKKTETGAQVFDYAIRFTFAKTDYKELGEVAKRLAEYLDQHWWTHAHLWDNPDGSQRFSLIPSKGDVIPRTFNRVSYIPGKGFIIKMVANNDHPKLEEIKAELALLRPSFTDKLNERMLGSGTPSADSSS